MELISNIYNFRHLNLPDKINTIYSIDFPNSISYWPEYRKNLILPICKQSINLTLNVQDKKFFNKYNYIIKNIHNVDPYSIKTFIELDLCFIYFLITGDNFYFNKILKISLDHTNFLYKESLNIVNNFSKMS